MIMIHKRGTFEEELRWFHLFHAKKERAPTGETWITVDVPPYDDSFRRALLHEGFTEEGVP